VEAQEALESRQQQQIVMKEELTRQTIRQIVTSLINQIFTGLNNDPMYGDMDKVHIIAEHLVTHHGARNPEEGIHVARRMAMMANPHRSMVDGVLDLILAEKFAKGDHNALNFR
jgi:hypothetical protein